MKSRSDKITSNGPDKASISSSTFFNETLTKASTSSQYNTHTSFKASNTSAVKNNSTAKCYFPIVSTWALKNLHSFHGKETLSNYHEIDKQPDFTQTKIKVEEMKNENEEDKEVKESSETRENYINNSPYSIKNLTSHLPKKPKLASVVYAPAPTYNEYAYISNSNFFRKFLSSHTPHKYYDSRLYNYPGLYFPAFPSSHFHNTPSAPKPPPRVPTPTK